jgi:hypothetical protein
LPFACLTNDRRLLTEPTRQKPTLTVNMPWQARTLTTATLATTRRVQTRLDVMRQRWTHTKSSYQRKPEGNLSHTKKRAISASVNAVPTKVRSKSEFSTLSKKQI